MIQINNQHHKDILIIVNGEEDNKTRLGSYNDLSSITWSRKKGYSRCNSRGSQSTMNEVRRPPDPINMMCCYYIELKHNDSRVRQRKRAKTPLAWLVGHLMC